jgi:iron-sulfur cluster insertion protein
MVKITFDDTPEENAEVVSVRLTENAAKRIGGIVKKDGRNDLFLRVSVNGGGCSGFSYIFKLDTEKSPDDIVIHHDDFPDVEMVIDIASMGYLKGSTVDFEETLEASQFVVKNPNAKASCGCGSSFSV